MHSQNDGWDKKREAVDRRFRRIYKALFGKPFPANWHVYSFLAGACDWDSKTIYLPEGLQTKYDIETAVHEMLHFKDANHNLPHGALFDSIVAALTKQAVKVK